MTNVGFNPQRLDRSVLNTSHGKEDLQEAPPLVKINSGSSSSSPGSNEKRSGNDRYNWNHSYHMQQRISCDDNNILRGAKILRQELCHSQTMLRKGGPCLSSGSEETVRKSNQCGSDLYALTNERPLGDNSDDWKNPWLADPWRASNGEWNFEKTMVEQGAPGAIPISPPRSNSAYFSSDSEEESEDTTAILLMARQEAEARKKLATDSNQKDTRQGKEMVATAVKQVAEDFTNEMDLAHNVDETTSVSYLPTMLHQEPASKPQGSPKIIPTSRILCGSLPPSERNDLSPPNALALLKELQTEEEQLIYDPARDDVVRMVDNSPRTMRTDPNIRNTPLPSVDGSSPGKRIVSPKDQQYVKRDRSNPCDRIVPPRSPHYLKLLKDPGFRHARQAGTLWQSLASQHVRFPSHWWNGSRSPPMGIGERRFWTYFGRHRVTGLDFLREVVEHRGSAGRLLLHVIVRDIMTMLPVVDIAIGCFHPNARGVRTTPNHDPSIEECRDIWLALRRRGEGISVIESLLKHGLDEINQSPLGGKHAVQNNNMRAVFGESPPIQTVFVLESDLYELFSKHLDGAVPPAAVLLQRFLF